jgi:threonine dehydrogenase-like Zn-dependent dehydrogenase
LGASQVISARRGADFYQGFAEATGARLLKPIIGKRVVLGGVDQTYECTGASSSLDDALRFTRNGGKVVLVGDPGIPKGVDWTTIFSKELQVQATYIYNHAEAYGGQRWRTFDLAIELMRTGKVDLSWMLTHTYRLEEYGRALAQVSQNGQSQAIKGAFSFEA